MRRNKKADLSLSINAIVVLILAITMLGLGLAFMKNIFGKATEEFQEVGGTVRKQMIDQMKDSDKIVDLSRPQIDMKTGEKKQVYMAFKNEGSSEEEFIIDEAEVVSTSLSGIENNCGLSSESSYIYLQFKKEPTPVQPGKVFVLPINIISKSSADEDTCYFELPVIKADGTQVDKLGLTVDVRLG